MASLFTRIIEGEVPSHRVFEDAYTFAFLDINPRQEGHTLVVPKREVDYLFDLPAEDYTALWATVHTVSTAIKETTGCARVVVIVLGYEIPHAHVHLIPTNDMSQIPFPAVDVTAQGQLAETAEVLRSLLTAKHDG